MIVYRCKCKEEFKATENTENARKELKAWKDKHRGFTVERQGDVKNRIPVNPGHGYQRLVLTRKKD